MLLHHLLGDGCAAVVTSYLKSMVCHIKGKAASHNGQAYNSNIKFCHGMNSSLFNVRLVLV